MGQLPIALVAFTVCLRKVGALHATSECPSPLKLMRSRYHKEDHCVCSSTMSCIGSRCSVGHTINANSYDHTLHGYRADCDDCHCVKPDGMSDSESTQGRNTLWVVGCHHKTGSFLLERIWGRVKNKMSPPLNVNVRSFRPVPANGWEKISDSGVDVVVAFHADGIDRSILPLLHGRHYRFVHLVRDPVQMIVSATLYELQRMVNATVHDKWFQTIKRHKDNHSEALLAMAEMMGKEIDAMANQFNLSDADHNAINMRLEDFSTDFDGTALRMFSFLGVPDTHIQKFMTAARFEDLSRKNAGTLVTDKHVTSGKFDKTPLVKLLSTHPKFGPKLRRIQRALGYG